MSADSPTRQERLKWFRDARFGMFVHWGIYSVLGRGEQIMSRDVMPLAEYEPLADRFRPAADWADRLVGQAADAGARYVVLTTRHHDGYCLFETSTHDFNAARTGPGRDLIAEYVAACRRAGLRVGFYYSIMNWRWPGFWDADKHPDDLPEMVEEVHTQVRELMSSYGKVDVLWYDGAQVPGSRTPGMWQGEGFGPAPAEFWRSEELNESVRELQPHILINSRSGLPEDFSTPEQYIRAEADRAWETCMTLNYPPGWGYLRHSMVNKTPAEVLFNLVDAVRLGGNFLFNVDPGPDGYLDDRQGSVLEGIGRWMARHGQAVYGTRPEGIYDLSAGREQGPCFHYGMFTCKSSTTWLVLFYYPGNELVISKVAPAIRSAHLLTTGRELTVEPAANRRWRLSGLPQEPPDPLAPVVRIEFEGPPYALNDRGAGWLEGRFRE